MSQINYKITLKEDVEVFTKKLFYTLFDNEYKAQHLPEIQQLFKSILTELKVISVDEIWEVYSATFKEIRTMLDLDAEAFVAADPAVKSLEEVYLAYPGFHAISVYRLSHQLLQLDVPILPRMMSEYVHGITGTDIHPGAQIGSHFFIDHATGIVIGETTMIGNHVKIFQGVTLGGIQVKKELASTKRHPTIEDKVTIYANATVLGGEVVIGQQSIIGANVCVTASIPKDSIVMDESENKLIKRSR